MDYKVVAILVIIFLVSLVWYKNTIYSGMIDGMWISTNEFNSQSDISSMILMITDQSSLEIYIFQDDEVTHNSTHDISIGIDYNLFKPGMFSASMDADIDIMSPDLVMTITSDCMMTLTHDDTVYFEGVRF